MNKIYPKSARLVRWYTSKLYPGACTDPGMSLSTFVLPWTDYVYGTENPNWKRIIALGGNATTSLSAFRQRVYPGGSGYVKLELKRPFPWSTCTSKTQELRGDIVGMPLGHNSTSLNHEQSLNKAKQVFIGWAKGDISRFLGGVAIGELKKTLRMIRNPAQLLKRKTERYLVDVRNLDRSLKGARSDARRRRLTALYLEATFGWQPLYQDVQNGLAALAEFRERRAYDIIKHSGFGKHEATSAPILGVDQVGNIVLRFQDQTKSKVTHKLTGGIRVEPLGSEVSVGRLSGFNFESFIPSAWELLPWSFLVDYFLNVGSIIDAWSFVNGRLAWACLGTKVVHRTSRSSVKLDLSSITNLDSSMFRPVKPVLVSSGYNRVPINDVVPSLELRLPGFGTKQMLNTAFLLHQGYVKRPFF